MKKINRFLLAILFVIGLSGFGLASTSVFAVGSPDPEQEGATGLTGRVPGNAPTRGATIANPVNGRTFTSTPITISGLCSGDVLVKVFSNNIFVGSAQCERGSFSMQTDLFSGSNALIARVYDALDQAGPDSNTVTVNFQDGQFSDFNQRVSLTSSIAKNGAAVGSQLSWPIILSGGTGPYAISVDWGDGTSADLKSVSFAGTINITHIYKSAGIYRVIVKATDSKGTIAFLQLVGVGSGPVTQSAGQSNSTTGANGGGSTTKYIWWPILLMLPLILATFWIGKKYELVAIRRQIEQQTQLYEKEIQR
ncbi:MAG: PKD domain-containing protein [Candidatus Saccharimonadales bacterium]